MKIAFLDFWDGFQTNNNFFIYLFKEMYENVSVSNAENSDFLIYSCFGNNHLKFKKDNYKKIFYTGENLRPDFNQCHYSFSFDFDDYNNKNVRIPVYHLYLDWFNIKTYGSPQYLLPLNYLNDNNFLRTKKNKFCATVFSNPVAFRFEILNLLSEYKKVDGYGTPFGNISPGEYCKYEILSQYKFSICLENSIYTGYCTEKLLHAKTSGTIPIYKSNPMIKYDFNPECFIDINNFENLNDFKNYIKEVDTNEHLYNKIKSEPLWLDNKNLNNIKSKIYSIIK